MPDRCLILRPWQVHALQAGATQIRVPMKHQPEMHDFECGGVQLAFVSPATIPGYLAVGVDRVEETPSYLRCPYPPGTVIVGRETWMLADFVDETTEILYRATEEDAEGYEGWLSPVTMPVWASRFRLPVLSAQPVRVSEISEADAQVCGVEPWYEADLRPDGELRAGPSQKYRARFQDLWTADYGPGCPWEKAWCWAVTVETVKGGSGAAPRAT